MLAYKSWCYVMKVCMMFLCEYDVLWTCKSWDYDKNMNMKVMILSCMLYTRWLYHVNLTYEGLRWKDNSYKRAHDHVIQGDNLLWPMVCLLWKTI